MLHGRARTLATGRHKQPAQLAITASAVQVKQHGVGKAFSRWALAIVDVARLQQLMTLQAHCRNAGGRNESAARPAR